MNRLTPNELATLIALTRCHMTQLGAMARHDHVSAEDRHKYLRELVEAEVIEAKLKATATEILMEAV